MPIIAVFNNRNCFYFLIVGAVIIFTTVLLLYTCAQLGYQRDAFTKALTIVCDEKSQAAPSRTRVGFFIVGLGNYINFTHNLVKTGRKFIFADMPNYYDLTYFLFTDRVDQAPKGSDIRVVYQRRLGWPGDSMIRPDMYLNASAWLADLDYVYSVDSDLYFTGKIGPEFLGDLVAVWHYYHKKDQREALPYEKNNKSCAYIAPNEGIMYFTGAVYGGRKDYVIEMWKAMSECTKKDTDNKITPIWHDESYLNRYFISHPPNLILTPSYYCGEKGYCDWPYERKVLFIDKDYAKARDL